MLSLNNYEVLPPHATPARFLGVSDSEFEVSGSDAEFVDPDTSSDDLGTSAELGGVSAPTATWDYHSDADVQNLTGMTESPMTPELVGPNQTGSGQAGQQVPTMTPQPARTLDAASLVHGVNNIGNSLMQITQTLPTGKKAAGAVILQQTAQTGISLHANLVLFGIIGIIVGCVLFGGNS